MIRVLSALVSAYEQDSEVSVPAKVEFSLWFPRNLSQEEIEWLHSLPKANVAHPQLRGLSHLEKLLRLIPAVFARYYPELVAIELPGLDPCFDYRAFTTHYCKEIVRDMEHVNLFGFPPEALRERDAKANIRLADLFVPTVFREQRSREQRRALVDLLNVGLLGKEQSVLVLGDPGMGKTMLLSFLALLHAHGAVALPDYTPPPKRIPLFISLREYAAAEQDARKDQKSLSILEYLAQHYKAKRSLGSAHPAFFQAAMHMGEAIVLLDGLDEVGSSAARRQMAARVRELRREYPFCPIWVTSRIHGYTHDIALPTNEFEHVMIGALDDAQIDDFLNRWYSIQFPYDSSKRSGQKNSLRQAIFRTKQVRALAENPLLLTLMAHVHRCHGNLPQDRGELYEECVEMLLRSWLEARERAQKHPYEDLALPKEIPRDYLEALAYHVQDRGLIVNDEASESRGLFSRDDALPFLTTHHVKNERRGPAISPSKARNEMRDFIDYACDRVGLLADRGGGKLSFLPLSFQEYLAAAHETHLTTVDAEQALFIKHFRDAAWSEVLLLRLYLFAHKRGATGRDILDKLVSGMLEDLERS
ncbi:MAG TPA: NACHT domain-containing protein, partial [Polyangium sp.]|nr:NACHT domain-containing protein [Polyangium sp.]